jgi:threonine aldolase
MIDLRSDTVTRPTPEMRRAMAAAEVDDDVLGHDPTVRELERRTAELLGTDDALFMPSGTMTNQVAIKAHTTAGDEVIAEAESHVYYYEAGAPAAISGVMFRLIPGWRGIFSPEQLDEAVRPADVHFPRPRLVCLENTHNRGGGSVWPVEAVAQVAAKARQLGLAMHLDGARLWNACVATGTPERQYARHFDSVSVCFSKGLGAPVGSALAGGGEFIERARRVRKMFGGGMRQAGIIAAGALWALDHHRERLADDHANARILAEGLAGVPGVTIDPGAVQTNLVYFGVSVPAERAEAAIAEKGVLLLAEGRRTLRAVTSLAVGRAEVKEAVGRIADALADA